MFVPVYILLVLTCRGYPVGILLILACGWALWLFYYYLLVGGPCGHSVGTSQRAFWAFC